MEWNGLFIGMEWNGMALDESRGIGAELELAIAILLELEWNGPRREPWNWCGIVAILGNSNSEQFQFRVRWKFGIAWNWWNCGQFQISTIPIPDHSCSLGKNRKDSLRTLQNCIILRNIL